MVEIVGNQDDRDLVLKCTPCVGEQEGVCEALVDGLAPKLAGLKGLARILGESLPDQSFQARQLEVLGTARLLDGFTEAMRANECRLDELDIQKKLLGH